VTFQNQQTFPYPGKEKLVDEAVYYAFDTTLYDMAPGTAKIRGAVYETPTLGTPTPKKLNGNYRIIDNGGTATTPTTPGQSDENGQPVNAQTASPGEA
jgi:hypothetical protein